MKHYVVVFSRSEGRLLRMDSFSSAEEALKERFATERLHRGQRDVEIVVLSGESRAAIENTHARYFKSAATMVRDGKLSTSSGGRFGARAAFGV